MKSTPTKAILLAAVLVVAAGGGAYAAAPTFDNETTNSASTSDLLGGETITDLTNSSKAQVVEAQVDSDDPAVEIRGPNGTVYERYSVSDMTQTYNDSANSTYHYNLTLQHDTAFGDVPIDANSSKNVSVVFINNSSASSPDETAITVTLDSGEDRSVDRLSSTLIDAGDASTSTSHLVSIESLGITLGDPVDEASMTQTVSVPNDSDGHTHEVYLANDTAVSAFDSGATEASSGDWLTGQSVTVEDSNGDVHLLKVYKGSAPSDASGDYAVYHADSDRLDIHFADDVSGDQSVTVATQPFGISEAFDEFGVLSTDYATIVKANLAN